LFIPTAFDNTILGFYALTVNIIFLPSVLITGSISQVYMQKVSSALHKNQNVLSVFFKLTAVLVAMTIPVILLFNLYGADIFAFVFGEKWRVSGEYASIVVFVFAVRFIVSPLSVTLSLMGHIKLGAIWKVLYFASTLALFFSAKYFGIDFITLLKYFVILEIIMYSLYYYFYYYAIKHKREYR
jgi:O-antigen/teichoic acid export membrane protein